MGAFPVQPVLDSCVRANEGPPPSASWISSVDSDHGGMEILSNKMAPDTTGQCSAMWSQKFSAAMEVYAQIDAFPTTGQSIEMWLNVQNGDTATPSGYLLRFWHHSGGGVGALELDRVDAGSNTRLFDEGATLAVGNQLGLWNDNGVLRVYVNGTEKTNFAEADTTYLLPGNLGVGTLNDSSQLARFSNVGGGGPAPVWQKSSVGALDIAGAANHQLAGVTIGNLIIFQVNADGDIDGTSVTFNDTNSTVESLDGTANTMTVITPQVIGVNASHQYLWIGRATATTVSIDITTAGPDILMQIHEFSEVSDGTTLATVIENATAGVVVNGASNSASVADTGVTTLGDDRLALNFIGTNDDSTVAYSSFTGETGGNWLLVASFEDAVGTDHAILMQASEVSAAGTINGGTMAMDSDPWGVIGFALLPVSTTATYFGSSSLTLTVGRSVSATRKTFSSTTLPLVLGRSVSATRKTFSATSTPLVLTLGTAGTRKTLSSLAFPIVAGRSVSATRKTFSAVSVPLVFSASTSVRKTTFGSVTFPLVVGISASARKTTFGSASQTIVFGLSTSGLIAGATKFGAASMTLTVGVSSTGTRKTFSSVTLPLVVARSVSGTRKTLASLAFPLIVGRSVDGYKKTFGATSTPIVFGFSVNGLVTGGIVTHFGSSTFPLVLGRSVTGNRKTFSAVSLPLALSIAMAGKLTARSSLTLPVVLTITSDGVIFGEVIPGSASLEDALGVALVLTAASGADVSVSHALGAEANGSAVSGAETSVEDESGTELVLVDSPS